MIIKNNNFKTIDTRCLEDKRLTWAAKGIYVYCYTKYDEPVSSDIILNDWKEDKELIKKELKNLIKYGYIEVIKGA